MRAIKQFVIHFCYMEKLTNRLLSNFNPIFKRIQPKFNGLAIGQWATLPQTCTV